MGSDAGTQRHAPDASDVAYPPGTVIAGKYRVDGTLGQGGMAVVVAATHLTLGHRVAIKLLHGDATKGPEALRRFHREAQIAAQLPGEHIARVTDVGQTERGEPFLVMELLDGRDLEAEVDSRGPLPIREAIDFLLQACEGVAEAHAAGLVHRDLKPGNLYVAHRRDGSPVVKVLDFGITKAPPGADVALTMTSSNVGTPLYMSPEQILSAKHVDHRCDQHALGAILYALLAGAPPFRADSITALAVVIATKSPEPLRAARPDVPVELEAVVLKALAKDPNDRYPDIAAFAEAIAPFGGVGAKASVKNISSVLANAPGMVRRVAIGTDSVGVASPVAIPGPQRPVDAAAQTSAAVTTPLGGETRAPERRRLLGFVAAVTVLSGAIAVALFVFGNHRTAGIPTAEGGAGAPKPASADAPTIAASAPAVASAQVAPDPTGTVSAQSSASVPAELAPTATAASGPSRPGASASSSAHTRAPSRPSKKAAHPDTELPPPSKPPDPTEVFNRR